MTDPTIVHYQPCVDCGCVFDNETLDINDRCYDRCYDCADEAEKAEEQGQ